MPFNIRVDVYHHNAEAPLIRTLAAMTRLLRSRNDQLEEAVLELSGKKQPQDRPSSTRRDQVSTPSMEAVIEQLRSEVERNSSVDASAIQLLTTLADKIEELKNSPTELQTLVESLRAQSDTLAAAVVANTPAEGEEPL
jgi:predicted RNase H-like nuclease (RuvC/YqgF family)